MQERYHSIQLDDILSMEEERSLYLPNFQRQFRWERSRQAKLLASYIVGIPIGGILLLQGGGDEFASRKLCYREENRADPEGDCVYLLDGQQRISTLKSVFYDFFRDPDAWEEEWENLYPKLRNRWFLNLKADEEEVDIFGLKNLIFNKEDIYKLDASDLENHIVCQKIHKKDKGKWFNPQFVNEEIEDLKENRNMVLQYIAEEAAPENWVPLFSIRSDDPVPLHESVVELIADRRVRSLKAKVKDGAADLAELLRPVEPSIESHIEEDESDKIDKAWDRLSNRWISSIQSMLKDLVSNEIPRIKLDDDEIDRAVSIFDNMNKGGTPLSTFDLVVARAAQDRPHEESLTDQINSQLEEEIELPQSLTHRLIDCPSSWSPEAAGVLDDDTPPTRTTRKQFLNIISVLTNGSGKKLSDLSVKHIKKKEHLELSSGEINRNSGEAVIALARALSFLQMRCGITSISDISYELTIIPIAYCLYDDSIWGSVNSLDKVEYWYWVSIFSGHYREKQNPRCIEDTKLLFEWLKNDGDDPFKNRFDKVLQAPGYSDKPILLRDIPQPDQYGVPGAIRETLLQYVLSKQPYDFLPSNSFPNHNRLSSWKFALGAEFQDRDGNSFDMKKEAHHICPIADAATVGEAAKELRGSKEHVLNSPVNLTYITSEANRRLRDKHPSEYVEYLSDLTLDGHSLPPISELKKRDSESKEEYHKRVSERRYEILKQSIRGELDSLRS